MTALPLWERLGRLRLALKLASREFAQRCGVDHFAINRAEDQSRRDPTTALSEDYGRRIAQATGCSYEWLMTGAGDSGVYVDPETLRRAQVTRELCERTAPRHRRKEPS